MLSASLCGGACTRGPEPCLNAGACAEGEECLANRCVPEGGEGVPLDSFRLVCRVQRASGTEPLRLEFDTRWQTFEHIDAAFLVVEAPGDAAPPFRVRAESEGTLRTQSGVAAPTSEGLVASGGRVRIDVTDLVRSWQGSTLPRAIRLSRTDGAPLRVTLGTASGDAPRLEVYGK